MERIEELAEAHLQREYDRRDLKEPKAAQVAALLLQQLGLAFAAYVARWESWNRAKMAAEDSSVDRIG